MVDDPNQTREAYHVAGVCAALSNSVRGARRMAPCLPTVAADRHHLVCVQSRHGVYTGAASAVVPRVDASGIVTAAIMAFPNCPDRSRT